MSKVADSSTTGGSLGWFKIGRDTRVTTGLRDSNQDDRGTKDLVASCGKMDFTIPCDIAPGDYLHRAEATALLAASGTNGAQLQVTCSVDLLSNHHGCVVC